MIRIVVDTNVLVSAVISSDGNEARLLVLLREGSISACVTEEILKEYEDVLQRPKFGYASDIIAPLLRFLREKAERTHEATTDLESPDPTDTKFIACAVAASADYLVTGNRRHFPDAIYGSALVVNAGAFLSHIKPSR